MGDLGELGKAVVYTEADNKGLGKDLAGAEKMVKKSAEQMGKSISSAGMALTKGISAPLIAVGGAVAFALSKIENAMADIRVGTGATGAALDGLRVDFLATMEDARVSTEKVGEAIAMLNTRTGLVGKPLQDLALQILNLSKVTGEDGVPMIGDLTRVLGDWSVENVDITKTMNLLYAANQKTGVSIGKLTKATVEYGVPLRQVGFSLADAIALISKFDKEGVNSEKIFAALRMGIGKLATIGVKDIPAAFAATTEAIRDAGSEAEATGLAIKLFGSRAGAEMAVTIREGRFEIDELSESLVQSTADINDEAEAAENLGEFFTRMGNKAKAALAPMSENFSNLRNESEGAFSVLIDGLAGIAEGFAALPDKVQLGIVAILAAGAVLGPLLVAIGGIVMALPALGAAFALVAAPLGLGVLAATAFVSWAKAAKAAWALWGADIKKGSVDFSNAIVGFANKTAESWQSFRQSLRDSNISWVSGLADMADRWEVFTDKINAGILEAGKKLLDFTGILDKKKGSAFKKGSYLWSVAEGLTAVKEIFGGKELGGVSIDQESLKKPKMPGGTFFSKPQQERAKAAETANVAARIKELEDAGAADTVDKTAMSIEELTKLLNGAGTSADATKAKIKELLSIPANQNLLSAEQQDLSAYAGRKDEAQGMRFQAQPTEALVADLTAIKDLAAEFPNILDDETIKLLAGDYWERFGANGRIAIDDVIGQAGDLGPAFSDAFEQIKEAEKKKKVTEKFEDFSDVLGGIGSIAGALGPKFAKFASAAQSASKIVSNAAMALSGNLTAVVSVITEMISAMGLFGDSAEKEMKGTDKIMDDLAAATQAWGEELTDVLVEFVRKGKTSFKDLANSIIDDILRITIQAAIVEPLISFGGDLLGFDKGGVIGGGKAWKAANGIVTRSTKMMSSIGPIEAGEGGGPGEAIIPLSLVGGHLGVDASGIGGGGMTNVEVNNYGATPATVTESVDPDGSRRVKVAIQAAVSEGLASGAFDDGFGSIFGLSRRGRRA